MSQPNALISSVGPLPHTLQASFVRGADHTLDMLKAPRSRLDNADIELLMVHSLLLLFKLYKFTNCRHLVSGPEYKGIQDRYPPCGIPLCRTKISRIWGPIG